MVMDTVISRCAEKSPVTVMARLALQRALEPAWLDELFEREAGTQYQRELLFSTTVELMSVVAVGLRSLPKQYANLRRTYRAPSPAFPNVSLRAARRVRSRTLACP